MNIYLYQKDENLGPFSEEELRQQVASGTIKQTDWAWSDGHSKWLPLHKIMTGIGPVFPPPPEIHSTTEEYFEFALFNTRFFVLSAVLGALIASLILFAKGSVEVTQGAIAFFRVVSLTPSPGDDKSVILSFIPAMDNYLFATVLLIFSMGIYELFVSKIDPAIRKPFSRPDWLNIKDLDDLKTHISEVVVMILIINFFNSAFEVHFNAPTDLIMLGGGILMIASALFITHKIMAHRAEHKKTRSIEGTVARIPDGDTHQKATEAHANTGNG